MEKLVTFDHRYFFNMLRPPMILNSGYELDVQRLYRNIGPILLFAFLGTFISTFINGVLLFAVISTPLSQIPALPLLECFKFGAILSPSDPITMLAIFKQLDIEKKIHTIIFGESVLNNAVAYVLFHVLDTFNGKEITGGTLTTAFFQFIGIFIGSSIIGLIVGFSAALILKYSDLTKFHALESCIIILMTYSSYLLSNSLGLTGIVSLLFTGIALKRYVSPNLSDSSQSTITFLFKMMAYLAENFVFIYLGIATFTHEGSFRLFMIITTFMIVLFSRFVSISTLSKVSNYFGGFVYQSRQSHPESPQSASSPTSSSHQEQEQSEQPASYITSSIYLPKSHQILLWWAGLRGAISFALTMNIESRELMEMRTTTLIVVVLTILVFGSSTRAIIQKLGIKTGVSGLEESGGNGLSLTMDRPVVSSLDSWFLHFDNKYLLPWFLKSFRDDNDVQ